MAEPIIELKDITKVYNGRVPVTALSEVSCTINKGEIFGIIGLSGAGKSTLVRCINLLERPTSGTVIVDGQDLTALSPKDLRKARQSIGMIFQQFNLLMQKTCLDNICFPLDIVGVPKEQARKRARELLEIVGLSDKADSYPAQLSGGQKQRIAIARALANNPKVLLCDEATSALDPTTTRSILELLKEINTKLGITIVVITHEMAVIEAICHRVAILDQSHAVEQGRVDDIFRYPKSAIARKLIFPDGKEPQKGATGSSIRLTFDGEETFEPVISNLVLSCGEPVNILSANTKTIDGLVFGQMIVQLPEGPAASARMRDYLNERGIRYEEV